MVVDDGSTDGTADVVRWVADDPRVRLVAALPPPPGWLGKPHACAVGAAVDDGGVGTDGVLAFVDADVRLFPDAVAGAVARARSGTASTWSRPWPRPLAEGVAERLVQPLVPWLWATTLPLRLAERSPRPSLAAANGQFLVLTRTAATTGPGGTPRSAARCSRTSPCCGR